MQNTNIYSEKSITRKEIQQAIEDFLAKGGSIRMCTPQVDESKRTIPIPLSAYEEIGTDFF